MIEKGCCCEGSKNKGDDKHGDIKHPEAIQIDKESHSKEENDKDDFIIFQEGNQRIQTSNRATIDRTTGNYKGSGFTFLCFKLNSKLGFIGIFSLGGAFKINNHLIGMLT